MDLAGRCSVLVIVTGIFKYRFCAEDGGGGTGDQQDGLYQQPGSIRYRKEVELKSSHVNDGASSSRGETQDDSD
jgi:hypothetical protein